MRSFAIAAVASLFVSATVAPCWAATTQDTNAQDSSQVQGGISMKEWTDAQTLLVNASSVLGRSKADPKMVALMRAARGVFVIPQFGHAQNVPGGHWGAGVLLANNNGQWSVPAFFSLGNGSLGQHVTANGAALILFIMNDRAMAKFGSGNWSLNSAPGTAIVDYSSAAANDLAGHGADFVAWSAAGTAKSDTELSISGVSFDTALNTAIYGTPDLRMILADRAPYVDQSAISVRQQMISVAGTANPQDRPLHVSNAATAPGPNPAR